MNINEALGKAIAKHRKTAGVRQDDMPYSQGSLSKIENGKQSLSMEKLMEVARAIGSTPSAIWATAEELLSNTPQSGKKTKLQKAAIEAAERVSEAAQVQQAYALVIEDAIATIPAALVELRGVLHRRTVEASRGGEREVFAHLRDRVDSVLSNTLQESFVTRARARGE